MQCFLGGEFWPLDPQAQEVYIEDIAHALAMQCRFNGHTARYYSVAEHSVHVSRHCSPENARWGLLHDASEAYICDIPRPLKPYLENYKAIEDAVMAVVAERFGLALPMPEEVRRLDYTILANEKYQLMSPLGKTWSLPSEIEGLVLPCWDPKKAESQFLDRYQELTHADA